MMQPRWRTILAATGALLLGGAIGAVVSGREAPRPPDWPSPSPVTLARVGGMPLALIEVKLTPQLEPYDYSGAAPEVEPTPVDGFYLRTVTLGETGGPTYGLPYRCLRCPPFRISPGVETLTLFRGRFYLEHQMSGFRALGHYRVDGERIAFFNDPNCSATEGSYRWARHARTLRFQVVDDPCPFEDERAEDFTYGPWTRVDACTFRIMYWWPALLGCHAPR
jgi:hypothetical protein